MPEDILKKHGAVSEPVALLMAKQIRELSGTTFGLSVTGIAGPTGGSPEKPVGTVFIGVASESTEEVKQYRFYGSREQIKADDFPDGPEQPAAFYFKCCCNCIALNFQGSFALTSQGICDRC